VACMQRSAAESDTRWPRGASEEWEACRCWAVPRRTGCRDAAHPSISCEDHGFRSGLYRLRCRGSLMALFRVVESHDVDQHELRIIEPEPQAWLEQLATAYRSLRTATVVEVDDLELDGLRVLSGDHLKARLADRLVPTRRGGNFDVTRSDLGEMILGVVGEEMYSCAYGYRSVRDRELVGAPGRGIDQIGVEELNEVLDTRQLALVLGEAKVSAEALTPPRVVDTAEDCLRNQHLGHISDLEVTADKVLDAARRCADRRTQRLMMWASELLRAERFDVLRLLCASVVVRPKDLACASDFGTFRTSPADYVPADVRFFVVRVPTNDIEALIDQFVAFAKAAVDDAPGAA
jgi:hypothetical protein